MSEYVEEVEIIQRAVLQEIGLIDKGKIEYLLHRNNGDIVNVIFALTVEYRCPKCECKFNIDVAHPFFIVCPNCESEFYL